jgi:hypothetical protein
MTACSQNGYSLSRGGCPNRWHALVNCDHGDSIASRFDSPAWGGRHPAPRPPPRRSAPPPPPAAAAAPCPAVSVLNIS